MADIASLIRQIGKQQGLTPQQIAVLIAGAKVESGLDPNAVGDGGTSYGLYQMHVGGAGGKTHAEAKRYLDPVAAIRNRARFVKQQNITDGAGFAALQRPADPKGYAAKVNAALKGLGATLNAPVTSLGMGGELTDLGGGAAPSGPDYGSRIAGLQSVRDRLGVSEKDTPGFWQEADQWAQPGGKDKGVDLRARTASLRDQMLRTQQSRQQPAADPVEGLLGAEAAPAVKGDVGSGYKAILQLGKEFGLRIDGSNQTTGGKHTPGSYHYKGMAVDFGDAKNDPAKLRQLAALARANKGRIKEFFYDPLGWYIKDGKIIKGSIGGHGDHVHIAM